MSMSRRVLIAAFLVVALIAIIIVSYLIFRDIFSSGELLSKEGASYATYSPDGKTIVSTRGGVGIKIYAAATLWDSQSGSKLLEIGSSETVKRAEFNPMSRAARK